MELELRAPFSWFLYRALGLLGIALSGWTLPGFLRYPLWFSIAALLRLGFLEELRPVVYARGRLVRGGEARAVVEVAALEGRVVAGLWPRFGVRFRDGVLWWLPLGPNWYLLWDALRRLRPELADWRRTPLAAYFLMRAKRKAVRPEVPAELYPIAEALELPLGLRGLAYLAGLFGLVVAQLVLPPARGVFDDLLIGFVAGLAGDALDKSLRLGAYARALSGYRGRGEGER